MQNSKKSYLVYYGSYENRKVIAICSSFDEAVEFMLTLMSTDRCMYQNAIRNRYNKESKTWVYLNDSDDTPCYFNEFEIEEWFSIEHDKPSIQTYNTLGQMTNPITYSINHDKKLCIYEDKNRTYTVLPEQPEAFVNFDKSHMKTFNFN